jgi:ribosomal protein S17
MRQTLALFKKLQLVGKIVSNPGTMQKTAKVEVTRLYRHPLVEKVRPTMASYGSRPF